MKTNNDHVHQVNYDPPDMIEVKCAALSVECDEGSRTDVSMITTGAVDDAGDVVVQKGLDWDTFKGNGSPVYHEHKDIQVGRALWVKAVEKGWLAKTQYAAKPPDWPSTRAWPADAVFHAVQKGELRGKSITVLPKDIRVPSAAEAAKGIRRVIETATVIGYSICKAPINDEAEVLAVSKAQPPKIEYLSKAKIELGIEEHLLAAVQRINTDDVIQRVLDRLSGKVGER